MYVTASYFIQYKIQSRHMWKTIFGLSQKRKPQSWRLIVFTRRHTKIIVDVIIKIDIQIKKISWIFSLKYCLILIYLHFFHNKNIYIIVVTTKIDKQLPISILLVNFKALQKLIAKSRKTLRQITLFYVQYICKINNTFFKCSLYNCKHNRWYDNKVSSYRIVYIKLNQS